MTNTSQSNDQSVQPSDQSAQQSQQSAQPSTQPAQPSATASPQALPVTAIIIDDEPLARQIVREYLRAWPNIIVQQECGDGFEGIKAIQQHHPDLIFLDIQMPKINGFEMLELVEEAPAVIFTTAYDEYAIRAFETHAVDYLLKPFSQERFDKALRKWLEQRADRLAARAAAGINPTGLVPPGLNPTDINSAGLNPNGISPTGISPAASSPGPALGSPAAPHAPAAHYTPSAPYTPSAGHTSAAGTPPNTPDPTRSLLDTAALSPAQQQRVVVKTGGKIKIIPLEDIHYLEASDDYVKIHTHNGAFLKNRTMSYFEQVLDPTRFVRTHRSYIINVQQVTRIEPYEKDSHLCILSSGAQVPVSKAGYMKLKAVLGL